MGAFYFCMKGVKCMAENTDGFRILLDSTINVDSIKSQLKNVKGLSINVDSVILSNHALANLKNSLKNNNISLNLDLGNTNNIQKQAQQTGQRIGQQIQSGINSIIQKGSFKQEFLFTGNGNNVAKQAQEYFQQLYGGIVTVNEQMEKLETGASLKSFTVNIKNAQGEVESLKYALKDIEGKTGQSFQYVGGSINDNGVIKQMNAISAKADSLQTKLEKIKSSYSDMNASRPIKDSNNISALSQQYDKVAKSIENVRNADSASFSSMVSNAQREITALENMVSQFRNAENVATQMKSVDISSGIAQAQERLGKLKANASGFEHMKQTIVDLDTAIANVGDKSSLDAFINKLKVAESQLGRVKAETKQLQDVNKIQLSFDTGSYQSKVDSLVARTNQWVDANGNARISTESLQTALNNLGTAYTNLNSSGGNTVANQQALIEAEKALDIEVKKVQSSITSMNSTMAKSSAIDALRQKYQEFYDKNTAAHQKWGKSLLSAINELAPGAEVSKQRVQELNQQLINTSNAARQAGKLGLSFFDTIKQGMQKFSYWTSSTFLVMKTITEIKEAVSFAKEMDSALTNINYTMDVTKSQLTDIGNSSIQMAKDLKTSASDILGAVTLYANAKETADSILKKSEAAIMLGNVTGMSGQESAKALQSVMNQFELTQDDLMYISDTIQKVSQNMAYDFSSGIEEIVGGIERSGSVAKVAGLDLNEYASMLGLVIEKTGLSGETIGTAYRTILTRITKASKIEGTSDEDISKAETALKSVGVQVRSTAGEFRDMTDIMEDLGKVWNNLNDVQQANISYEIAGTRQTNIIKTLLGYWTDYEDLATKAGNAAGTTLENQSKYEETLDAKTKELSTTMQSFWHNLIGAEEANGALAIFQKVATALDTISGTLGSLGTIGLGAGIFAGIKNIGKTYKCTDFKIIC